ncbi:Cytochrome c oxidase subunit VIIc [Cinara cedri]|uniref:Cytochrome c oxidase subunit VIIc n=1 Tax=Cinara cedri TaxID=506608 RepID=A0A5E4N9C2_9HEMI|nr:Cytochrome c oxidase subunit VIIc [Cinara cedri]
MIGSKAVQAVRQFSTTAIRRSDHGYTGPGRNLPFDVYSKYKFTLYTALFFSSGFGLPFLMVRYVRKRSG